MFDPQVRARTVGAFANLVLGGLHLHTTRARPAPCQSKFMGLAKFCQGEISTMPFGIDPAFRTTAGELYQTHLDDEDTKLELYNCSSLLGCALLALNSSLAGLDASTRFSCSSTQAHVQGSQHTIFHT